MYTYTGLPLCIVHQPCGIWAETSFCTRINQSFLWMRLTFSIFIFVLQLFLKQSHPGDPIILREKWDFSRLVSCLRIYVSQHTYCYLDIRNTTLAYQFFLVVPMSDPVSVTVSKVSCLKLFFHLSQYACASHNPILCKWSYYRIPVRAWKIEKCKKKMKYSCKMIPDWEMIIHLGNFFRNIKPYLLAV